MKTVLGKLGLVLLVLVLVGTAFGLVRQSLAKAQIEAAWQELPAPVTDLGSTTRLEIIPLYEKAGDADSYIIGHGVSYLVRTDLATILLDVGNNPDNTTEAPFLENLRAQGLAWDEIDFIFISHPHPDHIGGQQAWSQGLIKLGSQPPDLPAKPVYAPTNLKGTNLIISLDAQPFVLAPGVGSTGILPFAEAAPFSLLQPEGSEQALVINVEGRGLVLITGCGHPGMERLVARAEAVYGLPVVGIVGGLHYINHTAEDAQAPIEFMAARQPQLVALSPHDSTSQAIEAFRAAFPDAYQYVRVGEAITLPNP